MLKIIKEDITQIVKEKNFNIGSFCHLAFSLNFESLIYKIDVFCKTNLISRVSLICNGQDRLYYDFNILQLFCDMKEDMFTLHITESKNWTSLLHCYNFDSIRLNIKMKVDSFAESEEIKFVAYGYKLNNLSYNYDEIIKLDNVCFANLDCNFNSKKIMI